MTPVKPDERIHGLRLSPQEGLKEEKKLPSWLRCVILKVTVQPMSF
jgi:hypothetical protein